MAIKTLAMTNEGKRLRSNRLLEKLFFQDARNPQMQAREILRSGVRSTHAATTKVERSAGRWAFFSILLKFWKGDGLDHVHEGFLKSL